MQGEVAVSDSASSDHIDQVPVLELVFPIPGVELLAADHRDFQAQSIHEFEFVRRGAAAGALNRLDAGIVRQTSQVLLHVHFDPGEEQDFRRESGLGCPQGAPVQPPEPAGAPHCLYHDA